MLLIGSKALNEYITGIEPKDIDLCGTYDEAVEFRKKFKAVSFFPINSGKSIFMKNAEGVICEIEIAWEGSRAEKLLKFVEHDRHRRYTDEPDALHCGYCTIYDTIVEVPSLNMLYLLKMSHRYLKDSPHFLKTMKDIHLLRQLGCSIPDEWMEFFEEREKATYTYRLPNLNVEKKQFFDSSMTGVHQLYDHDTIHLAVAIGKRPAYMEFLSGAVKCDKGLFDKLPHRTKLLAGLEESYVLALERSLVPHPGKKTPKEAFDIALMKVVSSITSGWFREFCWENYNDIQEVYREYDEEWIEKFNNGVASGLVKLKES